MHNHVIANSNFLHEIKSFHPLSLQYKEYWKTMKRRCIEGYWFEGKWMPGSLYFYCNASKILMHVNGSKTKSIGTPTLRDVEWEKAYVYMEAKGFSGFEDDDEVTCNSWVLSKDDIHDLIARGKITKHEVVKGDLVNPVFKKFEPARSYLRKIHSKNLGKALFRNKAWNVFDLETRRIGKSYFAGNGMVNHNFLFDGATDYDYYLECSKNGHLLSSETLVAAIDGKYTKDLLSKCQLGLDNLPGSMTLNNKFFPSPLSKQYRGSFAAGKFIEAVYDIKLNGGWVSRGSRSKIHNRTFADNPLAGNGTGPNLTVIEEVGFMTNLIATLGALKDATYEGADKFGVIWMTGTGGMGDSAAISEAKEVFYNPEQYDCLSFEDIWEETGSIGYFVPYQMRLDEFRNENGVIDQDRAMVEIMKKRDSLKNGSNKKPLYDEMQNNPLTPSEAFLIDDKNCFPVAEMKEHKNWLKSQVDGFVQGQCGELVWITTQKGLELLWKTGKSYVPATFPVKKEANNEGCIQIWEHPKSYGAGIPFGMYVAGTDPYDQDQATTSASLGSTIIYKTFHTEEGIYELPVAEYTGRPSKAKDYYENVRKLLIYYNCRSLYENEKNGIKLYFEHKNSVYLLAKQPTLLKATEGTKVQRQYGIHMTKPIKDELELILRDWLLEERSDGKLNLHSIYSIPLLDELINYNKTGNFDRVIAFMLTILHRHQNHKVKVTNVVEQKNTVDGFISRVRKFF